jgi:hypothetical protein
VQVPNWKRRLAIEFYAKCRLAVFLMAAVPVLAASQLSQAKGQEAGPPVRQRIGRLDTPLNTDCVVEDLSEGATFRFEIAPKLPLFTFKIIPDVQDDQNGVPQSTVLGIDVFKGDSAQPMQSLAGCNFSEMEPPPRGSSEWFHTDDINFDGYLDLYLLTDWGATGNRHGCIWLYNSATEKFEHSKALSALSGYVLDSASKTIRTFERMGFEVYTANKYKLESNQPVLFWSEDQGWDANRKQFHCVMQERRNKVMVTTRNVWGTGGEPACQLPFSWFRNGDEK